MTDQSMSPKMKAIVRNRFGPPEVLEIAEVERPGPDDDQVLVEVRAASLNRADWYGLVGRPLLARPMMGWRRPRGGNNRIGTDYSGVVAAVGRNVTAFKVGDEVFGGRDGALAGYVAARHDRAIALKPTGITHEQGAAVGVAATTALQALRDHGKLQPGQKVLVNGASGGVGTFAVQVAAALGAEVTAVCGPRGVEAARRGGAGQVIDYTREDFTQRRERFDLIVDIAGDRPWRRLRRVMTPRAILVIVGGPMGGMFGPLAHVFGTKLQALFSRRQAKFFIAKLNQADTELLRDMLADGRVRPVIDRSFPFEQIVAAFHHLGEGHPQGKVLVEV
jgi:NADPH:quinone reductase-like Zn-dependent oxidoreductase